MQIRNLSDLEDVDDEVRIDDLSEVCTFLERPLKCEPDVICLFVIRGPIQDVQCNKV